MFGGKDRKIEAAVAWLTDIPAQKGISVSKASHRENRFQCSSGEASGALQRHIDAGLLRDSC